MDAKLSQGEYIGHLDELEEEFNVIPASRAQEVLRMRYERLRGVAGRIQNAFGDLASMGEKLNSLLSWRDPRYAHECKNLPLVSNLCLIRLISYFVVYQVGSDLQWLQLCAGPLRYLLASAS